MQTGMSRTRLYLKIKKITVQPIGEIVPTIHPGRAIQLMTHQDVLYTQNECFENKLVIHFYLQIKDCPGHILICNPCLLSQRFFLRNMCESYSFFRKLYNNF